jgi:hypothetical protein
MSPSLPVQVARDRGQRRRDDRLVKRGQQHPQQQSTDDHQYPPLGHGLRLPVARQPGTGPSGHGRLTSPPAS